MMKKNRNLFTGKKISTVVIGLSLLASSALYASGDHMGDHMHEGKKQNHANPNGMTNKQMNKNMKQMDHGKMNMNQNSSNTKPYHNSMMVNGFKAMISSQKPLMDGKNNLTIVLMKNGKPVKNADVKISFSMPAMPGMEFTEEAMRMGNKYSANIDFSMMGEWAYELMFKTSDGSMHKTKGSVNLK